VPVAAMMIFPRACPAWRWHTAWRAWSSGQVVPMTG
jgi:hypothetical protein